MVCTRIRVEDAFTTRREAVKSVRVAAGITTVVKPTYSYYKASDGTVRVYIRGFDESGEEKLLRIVLSEIDRGGVKLWVVNDAVVCRARSDTNAVHQRHDGGAGGATQA